MSQKIIDIDYDVRNRVIINLSSMTTIGDGIRYDVASVNPTVFYGENVLFRMSFWVPGDSGYDAYTGFSASDTFTAYLNNEFIDVDEEFTPMATSFNDGFNSTSDWALAAPASGRVCFQMDMYTTTFLDAVSGTGDTGTSSYLELFSIPSGDSHKANLIILPVLAKPSLSYDSWTYLTPTTDFLTTPLSTTEISMATDQSSNIEDGSAIRVQLSPSGSPISYAYSTVASITAGKLTLADAILTTESGVLTALGYETPPGTPSTLYYKKSQVDALLASYYTKSEVDALFDQYPVTMTQLQNDLDVRSYKVYSTTGAVNIEAKSGSDIRHNSDTLFNSGLGLRRKTATIDLSVTTDLLIQIPENSKLAAVQANVDAPVVDDTASGTFDMDFIGGSAAGIVSGAAGLRNTKVNIFIDQNTVSALTTDVANIRFAPGGGSFVSGTVTVWVHYWDLMDMPDVSYGGSSGGGSN